MQDGIDNCADYYVFGQQLKELYDLCKDVLEKHDAKYAAANLPLGNFIREDKTYDDFYWESLEDTIKIIEGAMVDDPKLEGDYSYTSSW